jgi:predicted NAD/FAD-binding protein
MRESIAVIGSGMAGLTAAKLSQQAGHHVTVYEAQSGHGMDAHSLYLDGGLVDVPLRVMSPQAWRSVIDLAKQVGVDTYPVNTYTSCSWLDQSTWFRSTRLPFTDWPFVGSWRYLNRNTLTITQGFLQLSKLTQQIQAQDQQLTLGELLVKHPFDPLFWRGLVLPMLTTICTCRESHLMAWPAKDLLALLDVIIHGDTLRRLTGGTPALVQALTQNLALIADSPVVQVKQQDDGVLVRNKRGDSRIYDRVIVATATKQLQFLDTEQFSHELDLLQNIRFDHGELWVHRDTRFLPKRRQDWTALNFMMQPSLDEAMFTVWVNAVEPSLNGTEPILQTWNPLFEPKPESVILRQPLARAVVHQGTRAIQDRLKAMHQETNRRVFFCGSWAYPGVPLLESAVRSAMAVVRPL